MSYFIFSDLIISFHDPMHVDPRSTLINDGAYGLKFEGCLKSR